MKKIRFMILLLLSLVFLSSCSDGKETVESDYYIYYINSTETAMVKQEFTPKHSDQKGIIEEMLKALGEAPKDVTNKRTIPEEVMLPTYVIPEGSTSIQLSFDKSYETLSGATETLHRAAIVKTLCQVPGISGVEFFVNQVALQEDKKVVGVMTENTFIEGSSYQTEQNIVLCYADEKHDALVAVDATAAYDGSTSLESIIIDQLIAGPDQIDDLNEELYTVIPEGTKCNSILTIDYCCYVDLSSEFLNRVESIDDKLVIYSIVNSLTSLPTIKKVKFTIEGETYKSYGTVNDFDEFFENNYDMIKES